MENLAVKEEHESPKDPWYFRVLQGCKMEANSVLAIICYVFITLLVIYWLRSLLKKHIQNDRENNNYDIENNIKNPLV